MFCEEILWNPISTDSYIYIYSSIPCSIPYQLKITAKHQSPCGPYVICTSTANRLGLYLAYVISAHESLSLLSDMMKSIKNFKLNEKKSPRCMDINSSWCETSIFEHPTYPCWMSSLSFATFLSSITVRDKTQSRGDVYGIVPQERKSLMTGSTQRLITSLASQTNCRDKTPTNSFLKNAFILLGMFGIRLHPPTFLRSSA